MLPPRVGILTTWAPAARSAAAIVHGFRTFDPEVEIAGVVFNRVGSDDQIPEALVNGFLHRTQIPEDPSVTAADAHALPWSLAFNSLAARHLREVALEALGQFLPAEAVHAA